MATKFEVISGTPIVSMAHEVQRVGRVPRKPRHSFNLKTRPWQIQPFMIAPVLPGETLENALLQARVVTDPLSSKLIGWFTEYYMFYVKLSDLDDWTTLSSMLVTGASTAGLVTAASEVFNYDGRGINYTSKALDRIVDEYFRDDGEAVTIATIDGVPLVKIGEHDYTQSVLLDTATNDTGEELPGEAPGLPPHMSAFSDHFAHWEAMRDMGIVDATFEDWLEMMGVSAPIEHKLATNRPELIRYVRQWTYPSNTIDPSTGAATSAAAWSVAERADKKRFFKEPGFIVGCTCARPKVYRANIESAGAHYLDIPYAWLPAVLRNDPYTSLRKFTDLQGPLAAVMTAAYWLDMNDLYQHGDQFVNYAFTATDDNSVALPSATAEPDYAAEADADALFANAVGGFKFIRQDGVCNLRILSAHSREDTSTPMGRQGKP